MTLAAPLERTTRTVRTPHRRRYLMCRPTHFTVSYAINPWMDPARPTDTALAVAQWERLRATYVELGHDVALAPPEPGLPDMVYAANGATVVDGVVLGARFRHPQRAAEADAYRRWFRAAGFRAVVAPEHVNEGQGDLLLAGDVLLAGTGFRTERAALAEAGRVLGRPVVPLELVDPRYYHLDTALTVLDSGGGTATVAYLPEAFGPRSRAELAARYPDAVLADRADAAAFGLNAVSDGRHVVLPAGARRLAAQLAEHGFDPVPVDVSELLKGGGGPRCCTLEIG